MKIVKDQIATLNRRRRVTVELDHDEQLMSFRDSRYYQLGGQLDDVVQGHVITESRCVYWCSIEQKWVQV